MGKDIICLVSFTHNFFLQIKTQIKGKTQTSKTARLRGAVWVKYNLFQLNYLSDLFETSG